MHSNEWRRVSILFLFCSGLEGTISSVCGSQSFEDAVRDNEEEIYKTQECVQYRLLIGGLVC